VTRVRIAVLADVHGNPPALTAVLPELDREPVDAIVVAGRGEPSGGPRRAAPS
jgi:Calcineurin-like phosphoesterase